MPRIQLHRLALLTFYLPRSHWFYLLFRHLRVCRLCRHCLFGVLNLLHRQMRKRLLLHVAAVTSTSLGAVMALALIWSGSVTEPLTVEMDRMKMTVVRTSSLLALSRACFKENSLLYISSGKFSNDLLLKKFLLYPPKISINLFLSLHKQPFITAHFKSSLHILCITAR